MVIGMKKSFFSTYKQAIEYVSVICSQRMGAIKVGCKRDNTLKKRWFVEYTAWSEDFIKREGVK